MNFYNYTTKSGLKVIFLKKTGFNLKYCGIGVKYGGSNLSYVKDGITYKTKPGIAHFIEHKLFQMPDGTDAFKTFTDLYASSNAYTTNLNTIYYFKTLDKPYPPLELLLKMYFTPYFTRENVELEKDIITSEINMNKDDNDYYFYNECINQIYPDDDYSLLITGEEKDVKQTNMYDLLEAYKTFYTPKNSILVIVGDFKENELFNFIDKTLEGLNLKESNVVKNNFIKSKNVLPPKVIYQDISQCQVHVLFRIDELNNSDPVICEKLIALIDSYMNISTKFNEFLLSQDLYDCDLDYQVTSHEFGVYISIYAVSKHPKEFAEQIIEKTNNLKIEELNNKVIELYIKTLKTRILLKEDSISYLGEDILSLALEDIDYQTMLKKTLSLNVCDVVSYIETLKKSQKTYIISKPKNSDKND